MMRRREDEAWVDVACDDFRGRMSDCMVMSEDMCVRYELHFNDDDDEHDGERTCILRTYGTMMCHDDDDDDDFLNKVLCPAERCLNLYTSFISCPSLLGSRCLCDSSTPPYTAYFRGPL